MYKTKQSFDCGGHDAGPLKVLALYASLKHGQDLSNTGELTELVIRNILERAPGSSSDIIRAADPESAGRPRLQGGPRR